MLILSRKLNESIVIGERVVVRILRISKDSVKIGIEAPPETRVHREEILHQTPKPKKPAPDAATTNGSTSKGTGS